MILTINPRIPERLHPRIARAVMLGLWRTNSEGVFLDVTGRTAYQFSAWTLPSVREVSLRIPFGVDDVPDAFFPHRVANRPVRSPECWIASWEEMVLWLAAHEGSHVRQYDRPRYTAGAWPRRPRQSEVQADRWAKHVLLRQLGKL